MAEDAGVAQARRLRGLLPDEVAEISDELEAAERHAHRPTEHGHERRLSRAAFLRRRLREAHRLIDGLHRRFPDAVDQSPTRRVDARVTHGPGGSPSPVLQGQTAATIAMTQRRSAPP